MNNIRIAIIGLGYVGMPLAVLFAEKYPVVGFDININRINELKSLKDSTLEIEKAVLEKALKESESSENGLYCTNSLNEIRNCNYYIISVPTPVNKNKLPNLKPLLEATKSIAKVLKKGDVVIYESTVYPGITENKCVPVLEKESNLKYNTDFFVGYSPERVNPGDKKHTIDKILKVTSGSTPEIAKKIDLLYNSVITAGTYLAPSIKVAEAAKVIENSQRDINIAFVNELSKIFNKLNINTKEVLDAASTKWNFLPFKPGLVGGHCIGVDPYYLAQKAIEVGYNPEIILAGRKINDSMGSYVASEVVKLMLKKDIKIKDSKVLVLGITFKENCPDVRNTKVVDVITQLKSYSINVDIFDPRANSTEVKNEYGLSLLKSLKNNTYDSVILAVPHSEFLDIDFNHLLNKNGILYDVKRVLKYSDGGL